MKHTSLLILLTACALSAPALAKEAEINIANNTSGLSAQLSENLARTAMAMGVKEPLTISKDGSSAKISGSNATVCTAKLSDGAEPKMLGISCK